jgi:NAD(P)-dependent dehydrogenase (short-subunit alcohol dehydrogenase family)
MAHLPDLNGRVVLVVQRNWFIASALAKSFESKGARVVLVKESSAASANLPRLTAAVLDGQSHELGRLLETRGIPFVVYTACDVKEGKFARAPTVEKPAPVTDVVARVEELLSAARSSS